MSPSAHENTKKHYSIKKKEESEREKERKENIERKITPHHFLQHKKQEEFPRECRRVGERRHCLVLGPTVEDIMK